MAKIQLYCIVVVWIFVLLLIVFQQSPFYWDGLEEDYGISSNFHTNRTKAETFGQILPPLQSHLDSCCGENMVYEFKLNNLITLFGNKKFDCSYRWLLDRYKLSDKHSVNETISVKQPGDPTFVVFVAAANAQFFPSLKALIVQLKQTFGRNQQIIAYDLGGITTNKQMMKDLSLVCKMEWRIFDFQQINENARELKSYAWKIFIIAQILMEFETFIWVDTSIVFDGKNLTKFLTPMQSGIISHVQMPSFTSHGINFATHSKTFNFLPLCTNNLTPKTHEATGQDPPMFEANFIIVHKSEQTRQMMKWALLCAAEPECIAPTGSTIDCRGKNPQTAGSCHRQDQSALNVLLANMEHQLKAKAPSSFLTHIDPAHPRNKDNPKRYSKQESEAGLNGLFRIGRRQRFGGSDDEYATKVACGTDNAKQV